MKRFKKVLTVLLAGVLTMSLWGCGGAAKQTASEPATESNQDKTAGDKDLIVVGYAQVGAESDWRTANTKSFQTTFVEKNGYKLIFDDAQQKQENQIKAIRNFIQQDVDYIVLAPVVETGWETVLGEAKEAGIPVILSDRMIDVSDDSLYTCWVGGNFIKEGEDAVAWLSDYLDKQGRSDEQINIVTLQGTIGSSAQVGRTKGVEDKMPEHKNWTMLDRQTGEFTQSKGQEVMESFLKSYDDIDVVIAENDNMAFGAIDAIKAAGKVPGKDIIIVSFDAVKAAFEAMIAGDMNVSVECNPLHGPRVAEIIQKLEKGESVEKIAYVDEGVFPAETAADLIGSRLY
ncbi:ABC transporter substrate-binding protein [Anaerocolumna sp. MB42-C2]|uniref:ABC transporter substrate-binding protein n=1 Tax=Anaerocolumna sp. MB42-C2 TaxID=3070997 RepID=UPI0027E0D286|nr:ABC transporter substrate-binding protein [Anaerocolumna sp. MB42-C2]WMJ87129.1 ABC transporter substrate-binding protein [Anaerocolumna sp. MB42-C2]